jgi:hypothetical protein
MGREYGAEPPEEPPRARPAPPPPEPLGSIIERFRGTEWDTGRVVADGPPPRRSSASRVVLMIGLLLVVGALAAGLVLVVGLPPSGVADASPTVEPTPTEPQRVMAAFWRTLEFGPLSYHEEVTGTTDTDAVQATFRLSLDVLDDEYTGKVFVSAGVGDVLLVRHEGVVYAQVVGETEWHSGSLNFREYRESPFLGLDDHRELAYGEVFIENGRKLHRLVSTAVYRPAIGRMLRLYVPELPTATVSLELIVSDAGLPIRATFAAQFEGDSRTITPPFTGSATYVFSRFEEPVTITAPKI